jgi:hypothetical protein
MPTVSTDLLRRLRAPAYLILGAAMLFPISDVVVNIWPIHAGDVAWRFGALGVTATAATAPLLVLLLIYALAFTVDDRPVVALVGVLAALAAVALFVAAGAFTLDALQMKARVRPESVVRFTAASAQALIKLLFLSLSATVLAVSAFRAIRAWRRDAERSSRTSAPLVVGRGKSVTPPIAERKAGEVEVSKVDSHAPDPQ